MGRPYVTANVTQVTCDLISDFRFLISDFRFPISDFRFLISDFRFSISDFRFLISDFWFPISDFRFPISDFRFPISDFRFPISDFRFLVSDFGFRISNGFLILVFRWRISDNEKFVFWFCKIDFKNLLGTFFDFWFLNKKPRFGRKIASFVCFLISFSLFLVSEFVVVQLYVFRLYNLNFQKWKSCWLISIN